MTAAMIHPWRSTEMLDPIFWDNDAIKKENYRMVAHVAVGVMHPK